jgi:hypothetical protein
LRAGFGLLASGSGLACLLLATSVVRVWLASPVALSSLRLHPAPPAGHCARALSASPCGLPCYPPSPASKIINLEIKTLFKMIFFKKKKKITRFWI